MTEVFVPRENINDDSVIVKAVYFESGALIHKGQLIIQIETSKTNIDIESPEDGILNHNLVVENEIEVGMLLFSVDKEDIKKEFSTAKEYSLNENELKISKAARKRADELSIPLAELGSGWITVKDVERKSGIVTSQLKNEVLIQNSFLNNNEDFILNIPYVKENISKRKQSEIKNLQMGNHQATSSTIGIDIKVPGKRIIDPPFLFSNNISDLIVFEGSKLLRKYPELNAVYMGSKFFGKYEDVNFGWSFDGGSNLKVLSIKNSDKISLLDLHLEVERLLDLYESNQNIPMDLLTSSTVTISDLSKTDATFIFPLINGYQSLILGVVSKVQNNFSIYATFDHRVSEGLTVTKFLTELKSRILSYFLDKDGRANLVCYACEKSIAEELSLSHRGFIKITLPNGDDTNLCRNCFDGW